MGCGCAKATRVTPTTAGSARTAEAKPRRECASTRGASAAPYGQRRARNRVILTVVPGEEVIPDELALIPSPESVHSADFVGEQIRAVAKKDAFTKYFLDNTGPRLENIVEMKRRVGELIDEAEDKAEENEVEEDDVRANE